MGAPWIVERRGEHVLVATGMPGVPEPSDWPGQLIRAAQRHGPGAVVVGKRVSANGSLVAMGEFVVHPKGLHSIGFGLPAGSCRFPEEVDGAIDGIAVFPGNLVAGLDEPRGAFGLLRWCLEARLRGGRVIAVPEATWVTGQLQQTIDPSDTEDFFTRFGFHPFSPDIDAIAANPDLARLRWNVRFFGTQQPFEKYVERGAFHWKAYRENESFRKRAEFLVKLAHQVFSGSELPVLDVGCGDGLYTQLLAERGVPVVGVDSDPIGISEAKRAVDSHVALLGSEAIRKAHFAEGSVYALASPQASARGAILLDVIEHLHNPARALLELARVIAPGGALLLSTPEWQFGHSSDPVYHSHEFTMEELQRLVSASGHFAVERTARVGGIYRDIIVVARRRSGSSAIGG
jgi:2-polyprenyl-3-methyl-5-hydroxy-6-metoxy-1,4-benzoquinol methylase